MMGDIFVNSDISLLCYFFGTACLKYAILHKFGKIRNKEAKRVGTVAKITLFPVKSLPGIDIQKAVCTSTGIKHVEHNLWDRSFMVTTEKYKLLSLRDLPQLALIQLKLEGSDILLKTADGSVQPFLLKEVKDNNIKVADIHGTSANVLDCGDGASTWISEYLDKAGCRIVYTSPQIAKRKTANILQEANIQGDAISGDEIELHDLAPIMLMTESSVEDLNTRLTKKVSSRNFRPNIVVTGNHPYDEDKWKYVYIGDQVQLSQICLDQRCILTTVDPDAGKKDPAVEPLKTMRKYRPKERYGPCFGVYYGLRHAGGITIGDPVFAVEG